MTSIIRNPAPLQTNYFPEKFQHRGEEKAAIRATYTNVTDTKPRNLHLYGKRGTGKTHISHHILRNQPENIKTCYIPCQRYDSQYKALQQLYRTITGDKIKEGYHTSDLQREIEKFTGQQQIITVLDEIDFLLLNDGDSLLYYLTRQLSNLSIITISANHQDLQVEERTLSSLQPQRISFPLYTGKQIYQILLQRAKKALKKQTLQHEALTYIASTTSNLKIGLHWLRTAAEHSEQAITEDLVEEVHAEAYQGYVEELLEPLTHHHRLVYNAIQELAEGQKNPTIQTGEVYEKYQQTCDERKLDSLTNRRISDLLKHLEILHLIKSKYRYGGKKGKTRDIKLY